MGPGSRIFMDFPHKPSSALYASASIWIGQTLINIRIHWNTLESLEHIASESEFVLPSYAFVAICCNCVFGHKLIQSVGSQFGTPTAIWANLPGRIGTSASGRSKRMCHCKAARLSSCVCALLSDAFDTPGLMRPVLCSAWDCKHCSTSNQPQHRWKSYSLYDILPLHLHWTIPTRKPSEGVAQPRLESIPSLHLLT